MNLARLRVRWVATSRLDFRSPGNRRAYHAAYDRYYHALGRALGWARDSATGYFRAPDGSLPGINDMEEVMDSMQFTQVRVWPLAERTREPLIHLVQVGEEVIGVTLCGQSARNPMKPTPPLELLNLERCPVCAKIAERRRAA